MEHSTDQSPSTSPRKKLKMDPSVLPLDSDTSIDMIISNEPISSLSKRASQGNLTQLHQEVEVGITEFVSPKLPGFKGILKKRYTDFLVNEILPSGKVVHLDNLKGPGKMKPANVDLQTEVESHQASIGALNSERTRQASIDVLGDGKSTPEVIGDRKELGVTSSIGQPQTTPVGLVDSTPSSKNIMTNADEPIATDASQPSLDNEVDVAKEVGPTSSNISNPNDGASKWQAYANEGSSFTLTPGDETKLKVFFTEEAVTSILALFNRVVSSPHRKVKDYGVIKSGPILDRQLRTKAHQEIRRIFLDRLDSYTDNDGIMVISAKGAGIGTQEWNQRGGGRGRGGRGGRGRGGRDGRHNQQQNRPYKSQKETYADLGGDYLHFTLYKENKDTMEVVSYLARQLNTKPRSFQFAGTKDRRAVTVQRISVYRAQADQMVGLGKHLRNAKIGNYEYHQSGLELGELTGNEFVITLRDCEFDGIQDASFGEKVVHAREIVGTAMKHLIERGFLNYFGLQRFGTFATRTDTVGMKMLQEDLKGAVDAILEFNQSALAAAQDPDSTDMTSRDDKARALAIDSFRGSGRSKPALDSLPKKFSAETNIIRYLPGHVNDYQGALSSIPRNLRLMYVHAYQSLIWNLAASYRWKEYGDQVIEGDLVLVSDHKEEATVKEEAEQIDADGEAIVQPAMEDRATNEEDRFERARALTQKEIESGTYSVFDIVLPTPGYDILYPSYMVSFYETTMASEQYGKLDPHDMRRTWKDISLSGSYRKLLARPGKDSSSSVVPYTNDDEQLVKTDLDRLNASLNTAQSTQGSDSVSKQEPNNGNQAVEAMQNDEGLAGDMQTSHGEINTEAPQQKLAVIINLQLGASQYATMALRELMKLGGAQAYKPDFGGGR